MKINKFLLLLLSFSIITIQADDKKDKKDYEKKIKKYQKRLEKQEKACNKIPKILFIKRNNCLKKLKATPEYKYTKIKLELAKAKMNKFLWEKKKCKPLALVCKGQKKYALNVLGKKIEKLKKAKKILKEKIKK